MTETGDAMAGHPSEDELIQHGAGDLAADAQWRIAAHIAGCAACRAVSDDVRDVLQVAEKADVPEPDAGFEDRLWSRIAPQLTSRHATWRVPQLVPIAAWAALVAAMVGFSVVSRTDRPASLPAVVDAIGSAASDTSRRVLLTALDEHFTQTELLLVELLNAPETSGRALQFERAAAGDLVASGRLYRETAEATGQQQFADIIDELEPVLVDVARSPDSSGRHDVDAWRTHIEDAGLLFKVRAATNEVRVRRSPTANANEGAL